MREISNLDLKIQLTNEYLRSGGTKKIKSINVLQDLLKVEFYSHGKANPETVSPSLNAFMTAILASQLQPPYHSDNHIAEYKSFIQKNLFFDQIKITKQHEIDDLIKSNIDSKGKIYRGQSESRWRLYSSLQRHWIWDGLEKSQQKYKEFLMNIVLKCNTDFQNELEKAVKKNHLDAFNDVSVLGFLQHHGCPTPLLDWTYDFNTALYFGIDNIDLKKKPREIDNYFSLYFINEEDFSNGGMRTLIENSLETASGHLKNGLMEKIAKDADELSKMQEHFKNHSYFDKDKIEGSGLIAHMTKIESMSHIPISYFSDNDADSGIIFSLINNDNIKKQQGVFTWNSHFGSPLEKVGNEQYFTDSKEGKSNEYRFCECYNISKDLVPYIKEILNAHQVNNETIYPNRQVTTKYIYDEFKKKAST